MPGQGARAGGYKCVAADTGINELSTVKDRVEMVGEGMKLSRGKPERQQSDQVNGSEAV